MCSIPLAHEKKRSTEITHKVIKRHSQFPNQLNISAERTSLKILSCAVIKSKDFQVELPKHSIEIDPIKTISRSTIQFLPHPQLYTE
jgi:hypothetical protein